MKRAGILFLVAVQTLASAGFSATGPVETVSPGGLDRVTLVRGTAPTFSWGAVRNAGSHEVMVYELSEQGKESGKPTLKVTLPGSASSWTPDARHGLEPGKRYVWFVRSLTKGTAGDWSAGRMFAISSAPSLEEVEAAMDVLRRYAAVGEGHASSLAGIPEERTRPQKEGEPVWTLTPPPARLAQKTEEVQEREQTDAIALVLPTLKAPVPLQQLGLDSVTATPNGTPGAGGDAIAVRGEYASTDTAGEVVVGYLGVAASNTSTGEFDGFAVLKGVDEDEIGVLGFSNRSSTDNFGVVGVGRGAASAGRFYNADAAGAASNQVLVGTSSHAISASGPINASAPITWDCPSDMDRAGTWCIDKTFKPATNGGASIAICHDEGKILCPVQALITCDQKNIRNGVAGSCGALTDTVGAIRTFSIDTDPTGGGSVFDEFVTYLGANNGLGGGLNSISFLYFCCKPVSP